MIIKTLIRESKLGDLLVLGAKGKFSILDGKPKKIEKSDNLPFNWNHHEDAKDPIWSIAIEITDFTFLEDVVDVLKVIGNFKERQPNHTEKTA